MLSNIQTLTLHFRMLPSTLLCPRVAMAIALPCPVSPPCHRHSYLGGFPTPQLYPHSSQGLDKNVGALHELILTVHSGFWIQVKYSYSLVGFPALGLSESFCLFH